MKNPHLVSLITLAVFSAITGSALAAEDAGRVMFVAGKAMIVDATGQERVARKGAVLKQGDRLVTSDKGMIQVKMRDQGVMAIRPDTDLKLNNLLPPSKSEGQSQALLLTRGGVRVLTGSANNKLGYLIKTAATSLKLREGDTEALVIPPLTPAAGKIAATPAGTYNRVNSGTGTFQVATGTALTLAPNQVSYTTSLNPTPVLVASLPTSYINTTVPLQINSSSTTTLVTTAPLPTLTAPTTVTTIAPVTIAPTTLTTTTLATTSSLSTTTPTTLTTMTSPTITSTVTNTTLLASAPVTMVAPLPPPPIVAPAPVYTAPILQIQPITQPILQPIYKICTTC